MNLLINYHLRVYCEKNIYVMKINYEVYKIVLKVCFVSLKATSDTLKGCRIIQGSPLTQTVLFLETTATPHAGEILSANQN